MPDIVTAEKRSLMMSGIHNRDTQPELWIRKAIFSRGFRYRLHSRSIPGKPDIVLPKYKAVIFAHGCFWHGHKCLLFRWPSSHIDFWKEKIERNRKRDLEILHKLKLTGWRVLVVWECATKGPGRWAENQLLDKITEWIIQGNQYTEILNNDAS
ncbi:very short patch repair endonuclease [Dehalogenimonas alkenigignens]|uniref:very short patch repair endonuclease n=1 Tax=Dehalogenimonas alkenigignens TaxID=1217799 RepID=UPI000D580BA3|nr:DNA mismatch endonuclease Vsr [Dehalogenimonas alkenigignens]PVV83507.1 very short patch repair endonuclease [Dehalogenimonas alkenigignens]